MTARVFCVFIHVRGLQLGPYNFVGGAAVAHAHVTYHEHCHQPRTLPSYRIAFSEFLSGKEFIVPGNTDTRAPCAGSRTHSLTHNRRPPLPAHSLSPSSLSPSPPSSLPLSSIYRLPGTVKAYHGGSRCSTRTICVEPGIGTGGSLGRRVWKQCVRVRESEMGGGSRETNSDQTTRNANT